MGPQAEDGSCAQEIAQHPPGLENNTVTVRFGSDGTAANIDFSTWNLFSDVVAKVTTSGRYLPPTGSICLCLGTLQKGFLRRWTCFLKNRIHFVLTRHSCRRSRQSHQTPFAETVILSS